MTALDFEYTLASPPDRASGRQLPDPGAEANLLRDGKGPGSALQRHERSVPRNVGEGWIVTLRPAPQRRPEPWLRGIKG